MRYRIPIWPLIIALFISGLSPIWAAGKPDKKTDNNSLDTEIERIKKEALLLNRDLVMLENELLFKEQDQLSVFLSMPPQTAVKLKGIELKVDGKAIANNLYTETELKPLHYGGKQRLFLGRIKRGKHKLLITFAVIGEDKKQKQGEVSFDFNKNRPAKFLELKMAEDNQKEQPLFSVKEWE